MARTKQSPKMDRRRHPGATEIDVSPKRKRSRKTEIYEDASISPASHRQSPRPQVHLSPSKNSHSSAAVHYQPASSAPHLRRLAASDPWRPVDKVYSPSVIGLHEEIEDFHQYIKPSSAELKMRKDVVERSTRIIHRRYPHAVVKCFGSYQTKLFLPNSDLDLVVFGKWTQLPLHALREEFLHHDFCTYDDAKILDKTSVPLLKVTDRWTQVKVDITFNMVNGINSATWINEQIERFPCVPKLVLVLKQFLHQRNLNEVFTGGMSSYSLILLVVSFLQRHPRLRPTDPPPNLGVLLIEFLELYGRNFNYDEVAIRVMDGGSYLPKHVLANMPSTVPKSKSNRPGMLSIEDPLQVGHDIARFSYGFQDVKTAFEHACARLTQQVLSQVHTSTSILSSVIRVHFDVFQYRRWCEAEYAA